VVRGRLTHGIFLPVPGVEVVVGVLPSEIGPHLPRGRRRRVVEPSTLNRFAVRVHVVAGEDKRQIVVCLAFLETLREMREGREGRTGRTVLTGHHRGRQVDAMVDVQRDRVRND
jgi:hypothetical protein